MCIVTLKDGTTYYINTDSVFTARSVVEYKLRNRGDSRSLDTIEKLEGCSTRDNSCDAYDGEALKNRKGWAYKWN